MNTTIRDDRGEQCAEHQCISPSTIGPSNSAGRSISPAVSAMTPTSTIPNVPPSVRNVPAEAGTTFFAASEPPIASAGDHREEAAEEMSMPPKYVENVVAP